MDAAALGKQHADMRASGVSPVTGQNYQISSGGSVVPKSPSNVFSDLQAIADKNTATSAKFAEEQRDWSAEQARISREFNSAEAAKNRKWQEMMSGTAHQREVKDLIAAGLNPVLSANGGNGASVTSGATASSTAPQGSKGEVDTSTTSGMVGLMSALIGRMTSLETSRVSAETNMAVADKYNAMSKYLGELNAHKDIYLGQLSYKSAIDSSNIHAAAQRYSADAGLAGTRAMASANIISSNIHAAAQKYASDKGYLSAQNVAEINGKINKELQANGFKHDFDMREMFPSNAWEAGVGEQMYGDLFHSMEFSNYAHGGSDVARSLNDIISTWAKPGFNFGPPKTSGRVDPSLKQYLGGHGGRR